MSKKMTATQEAALRHMAEAPRGETSGYDLKTKGLGNTATLQQLALRKYVAPFGLGHSAFPANASWRITDAGRAAIARAKGEA